MARIHFMPDGRYALVPDNMPYDVADAELARRMPDAYGIEQKHGFVEATKAGAKEGLGAALTGIGSLAGSQHLQDIGAQVSAPGQEAGAYHPYTAAEETAKYKQGVLPGLGASLSRYVTEPLGGMVGRYGVPTAVGAGAAALAPEAAVAGIGAGALGTVASDFPMEVGEDVQRRQERQAQGFAVPEANKLSQIMSGLAEASLLPLTGSLGQKLVTPFMKTMGPSLAETAQKVAMGQMTKDEAVAQLNSVGKNVLLKTGEAGVVGPVLMTGTEALRTAQSGQDLSDPEAQQRMKEAAEAGITLAPLGALGGLGMRRAQTKQMGEAADQFGRTYADAQTQDAVVNEQRRKDAAWQAQQADQQTIPLEEPKQPKGGAKAYAASVAEAPDTEAAVPVGFFNKMGIPNNKDGKLLRSYEGTPLADTAKLSELRDKLADISNPETAPDWLANHKNADTLSTKLATTAADLGQKVDAHQNMLKDQRDMFAEQDAADQAKAQQIADETQKRQQAAMTAKATVNAQTHGQIEDMFSGERAPIDMRKPEEAPAETRQEFEDQNAALHAQFQAAHEKYQQTGDDTELNAVLAKAKEQLGPYQEAQNQASTKKLFDTRGRPTQDAMKGVDNGQPTEVPEGEDRAGNAPDVSGPADVGTGGAGVEPEGAGPSVQPDEQPAVAEEPQPAPVTPQTTSAQANREWARSGAAKEYEQTFKELHPEAQDHLRGILDQNKVGNKELTGKQLKDVLDKHVAAVAADNHKPAARATGKKNQTVHTKEQAAAMVKNITEKWHNAPDTEVKDFLDLSPAEQKWVNENKAAGFINEHGGITIVSDRNTDLHDVKATLFHEALGHYGLRSRFGAELRGMLRDMYDTHAGIKKAADAVRSKNPGLSPEEAVEEVLAERQVSEPVRQSMLDRVAAVVRSYLRKMGVVQQYTKNDVASILQQARKAVVQAAPKAQRPLSSHIPEGMRVTIDYEGPDGEPIAAQVEAKTEMRAAEQRLNILQKILECIHA